MICQAVHVYLKEYGKQTGSVYIFKNSVLLWGFVLNLSLATLTRHLFSHTKFFWILFTAKVDYDFWFLFSWGKRACQQSSLCSDTHIKGFFCYCWYITQSYFRSPFKLKRSPYMSWHALVAWRRYILIFWGLCNSQTTLGQPW